MIEEKENEIERLAEVVYDKSLQYEVLCMMNRPYSVEERRKLYSKLRLAEFEMLEARKALDEAMGKI